MGTEPSHGTGTTARQRSLAAGQTRTPTTCGRSWCSSRGWPRNVARATNAGRASVPDSAQASSWIRAESLPNRPTRLLRQVGSDGIGGIAIQAVAGVVVPAGGAGILVAGVVLHVAQGGAGVQ